jgi:hypothetical protein
VASLVALEFHNPTPHVSRTYFSLPLQQFSAGLNSCQIFLSSNSLLLAWSRFARRLTRRGKHHILTYQIEMDLSQNLEIKNKRKGVVDCLRATRTQFRAAATTKTGHPLILHRLTCNMELLWRRQPLERWWWGPNSEELRPWR